MNDLQESSAHLFYLIFNNIPWPKSIIICMIKDLLLGYMLSLKEIMTRNVWVSTRHHVLSKRYLTWLNVFLFIALIFKSCDINMRANVAKCEKTHWYPSLCSKDELVQRTEQDKWRKKKINFSIVGSAPLFTTSAFEILSFTLTWHHWNWADRCVKW